MHYPLLSSNFSKPSLFLPSIKTFFLIVLKYFVLIDHLVTKPFSFLTLNQIWLPNLPSPQPKSHVEIKAQLILVCMMAKLVV
jgi:hypothetical protein